jgi:hypothetical protein
VCRELSLSYSTMNEVAQVRVGLPLFTTLFCSH